MSWNRWAWNPPKRATDVEQTPCFWIVRFALWRRCCRSSFFFAFGLLCRLSPPRSITVSFLRLACLSIYLVLSSFDHILKWQCRQCLWFADEAKQHSPNNNKMTMMMIFLRHFSFFFVSPLLLMLYFSVRFVFLWRLFLHSAVSMLHEWCH